jgi:hypothetical protein
VIYVTPSPGPATQAPTAEPTVTATLVPTSVPTVVATATTVVTPAPTQPRSAPPSSSVTQYDPLFATYYSDGYLTVQILLPVINDGNTWVELDEFNSSWTAYDSSGAVTETNSFDAAAPKWLAPGATSYLVSEWFGDQHKPADFNTVQASGRYKGVDAPDTILTTSNITTRKHEFGGVEVTGVAHNPGTTDIDNADVVAIFYNANGTVLGFAKGYIDNATANADTAFQIDSSFATISLADIAKTEVYASPWDF